MASSSKRNSIKDPEILKESNQEVIATSQKDAAPIIYKDSLINPVWGYSLFSEEDIEKFQAGTHYRLYELFGSHHVNIDGQDGFYFSVWAPNATFVSVVASFNNWNEGAHPLFVRSDNSGIWEGFIPGVQKGDIYKYFIHGYGGTKLYKGDPYARYWERRSQTGSITWFDNFSWQDEKWLNNRKKKNALDAPWSIYEVHLASWMRPDRGNEDAYNTYQYLAQRLVKYVNEMGFTHVELMPVMEHPYDGSWGYQGTGYYAPTSRFGTPEEFKYLVNLLHENDIGVILDWVPSHFPYDSHGLFMFDGAHTYEYADMRKGFQPDWKSYIFNYSRGEVKSFLISNARFWLEQFHIDGIRVDAVSSIIFLSYSRKEGEWEPNAFGGDTNLEAIDFIQEFNKMVYHEFPDVQTIAEEATDYQWISRPIEEGGLGFGMKWMMGWMNDTLDYFKIDHYQRQYNRDKITFSIMYAFTENYLLPLSHDEVVHGKSPMIYKMPGDEWQKFANLRLLYTYMFTHPGAKLLFMGNEFGQTMEWDYKSELNWELLHHECHSKLRECVIDLNKLYSSEKALHELQFTEDGFEWIHISDAEEGVLVYLRKGKKPKDLLIIALNLTAVPKLDYRITVEKNKKWTEIFNSDLKKYWGSGDVFNPDIPLEIIDLKKKEYQITVHIPALAAVVIK